MEIQTVTLERTMCRICLSKGTYNIFEDQLTPNDHHQQHQSLLIDPTSEGHHQSILIIDALNYFSEFKISQSETINEPAMLCENCYGELLRCFQFRTKINESECLLQKDYVLVDSSDEEDETGEEAKTGLTLQMVDLEPYLDDEGVEEPELSEPVKQPKIHHAKPRFELTNQVSNILRHVATSSSVSTTSTIVSSGDKRKESEEWSDSATPKKIQRRNSSSEKRLDKTLIVPNYIFTSEVEDNLQEKNILLVEKTALSRTDEIACQKSPNPTDTDDNIFYCKHCPKAFSTAHHLLTHTKSTHLCQYCLKQFPTVIARNKHVREAHKTFLCSLCSFQTQYGTNLRAHLRNMHSVALPSHVSILQTATGCREEGK